MGAIGQFAENMYRSNPRFRAYADSMRGKSVDQIMAENGYNLGTVQNFMNQFQK